MGTPPRRFEMRILDIALKDLRQLMGDRQTALFLLIMPIGFTRVFNIEPQNWSFIAAALQTFQINLLTSFISL